MKMEVETGVTKPFKPERPCHQQRPEARRAAWKGFSFRVPEGDQTCRHLVLDFWPPEPEESTFLLF